MLSPNKTKYRKRQKGRLRGNALRGATIAFGDVGLKVLDHAKLTSQQIEAARVALMRHIKRGGKVWIRVFPDQVYNLPAGRNSAGFGKGAPRAGTAR
jgi:large subunit ribosomal protein L16